jgi:hypothetical protein
MSKIGSNWETRILCSDGNCIGVVGADGHCKLCGKPYGGELSVPMVEPEKANDAIVDSPLEESESEDPESVSEALEASWEDRTLCIDESCIGVVGPDGRCKTCGKLYTE